MTSSLTLTFNHVIWTSIGDIYLLGASTVPSLDTLQRRGQEIISGKYLYKDHQSDLQVRPCDLKVKGAIYSQGASTVPSLATFKPMSQEILSGNHSYKDHQLNLTFDHVNRRSIGVVCSLGASTIPSLATFKQRGQGILSGHRLVYTQTDRQVLNSGTVAQMRNHHTRRRSFD